MSEAKTRSRWTRTFFLVLKVYAGLSAVLVTGVLALMLWAYLTPTSATEDHNGAGGPEPKMLSLPPVELKYELPRLPASVDGLLQVRPESDGLVKTGASQPDGATNRSQPVRSGTNQTPAAAGSGR